MTTINFVEYGKMDSARLEQSRDRLVAAFSETEGRMPQHYPT